MTDFLQDLWTGILIGSLFICSVVIVVGVLNWVVG